MNVEIITKQDLVQLKTELVDEMRRLLGAGGGSSEAKWLRSADVRKMLGISPGTLQNLRVQKLIKFTKVGGTFFYKREDIEKLLSQKI